MSKVLQILLFLLCNYFAHTAQPYFPPQIVFNLSDNQLLFAIDQIHQRAAVMDVAENAYVFKHIPYAIPDSPEDKNYVQLIANRQNFDCVYETYWTYGGSPYNLFPAHWQNRTSCEVKNYIQFNHPMVHSTKSSDQEDYWHATESCEVDGGATYPCEEIYFKKNTDVPLRYTQVRRVGWAVRQVVTQYNVISVGEIDDKYFETLPKNWSIACRDVNLGVFIYSQTTKIPVGERDTVQVWLPSPPHRINGNDTVFIEWNATVGCTDCLSWEPKQLAFNIENFQERQNITFTRTKAGPKSTFHPIFNGGGFDLVLPILYPLFIE